MHNNEKIGVGILTCNRKRNCKVLFDCLASCIKYKIIDELILVKNREFEYDNFDFEHIETNNIKYLNVKEDVGVGYCKNAAFLHLLNKNCDHIFLIEDDTIIKDPIVFAKYIDTAKHFKMEHLVFGYGSGGSELDEFNEKFNENFLKIYEQEIEKNLKSGLIILDDDNLKLTEKGRDLSNQVELDFFK